MRFSPIFIYVASPFLSTCLRSKPLLARGQSALRAYNDIGECLFVQARQPFANIVKLLCSFLCPLSLGAFALLLRSLVANVVEKFSALILLRRLLLLRTSAKSACSLCSRFGFASVFRFSFLAPFFVALNSIRTFSP